jgi:hypothetical protein
MGQPTVYADTLNRAAAAIGGEARLAAVFQVPEQDLQQWLLGKTYPPTEIYQKALDLLISVGSH